MTVSPKTHYNATRDLATRHGDQDGLVFLGSTDNVTRR